MACYGEFISHTTYVWDPDFIITVAADALAPVSARSSAGTVLTTKSDMPCFAIMIPNHLSTPDDVIHNGRWNLEKSRDTSGINA